jgi:hypothetical protein
LHATAFYEQLKVIFSAASSYRFAHQHHFQIQNIACQLFLRAGFFILIAAD